MRSEHSQSSSGINTDTNRILTLLAQDYIKEKRARRRWGIFFKLFVLAYLTVTAGLYFTQADFQTDRPHTAIVQVAGLISPERNSAVHINQSLRDAFKNPHSSGVVVQINSPGGTPVQAAQINEEMQRLKKAYPHKPLYAAVTDISASGGYYVAVAADKIFAHPSSIVGSIGVLMNGFGFTGAMHKLGIERRLLTAGENKGILDPFSPLEFSQQRHAQQVLDEIHQQFILAVREGRGDRLNETDDIYSGLYWTGERAKELGLIDDYASTDHIAREVIGAPLLIDYTHRPKFWESFIETATAKLVGNFLNPEITLQ